MNVHQEEFESESTKLPLPIIIGSAVGVCIVMLLICLVARYFFRRTKRPSDPQDEMQMAAAAVSGSGSRRGGPPDGGKNGSVIVATGNVMMRSPGRGVGPPTPNMKSDRFKDASMHSIY